MMDMPSLVATLIFFAIILIVSTMFESCIAVFRSWVTMTLKLRNFAISAIIGLTYGPRKVHKDLHPSAIKISNIADQINAKHDDFEPLEVLRQDFIKLAQGLDEFGSRSGQSSNALIDEVRSIDEKLFNANEEASAVDFARYRRDYSLAIRLALSHRCTVPAMRAVRVVNFLYGRDLVASFVSLTLGRAATASRKFDKIYSVAQDRPKLIAEAISLVHSVLVSQAGYLVGAKVRRTAGQLSLGEFRDEFITSWLHDLRIKLVPDELPGMNGCLIAVGRNRSIFYDHRLNGFARSFTIVHEVGHLVLDHRSEFSCENEIEDTPEHDEREYVCDQFASFMLRSLEGIFILIGGDKSFSDYDREINALTQVCSAYETAAMPIWSQDEDVVTDPTMGPSLPSITD